MSRRLISRISRCRRSQSPKELDSFCTASFSQGGWRLERLPPSPAALSGLAAGSGLRDCALSCLEPFFGTRLITLRGSPPAVKSCPGRSLQQDLQQDARLPPAQLVPAAPEVPAVPVSCRAGSRNLLSCSSPMTITRTTQNQLSKGDFEAIEGEWLAQLEKDPADLDYFVGVARALIGTGEESRASSLLEILDDQLRESGRWAARLQLLKRAGALFLPADKLHPTVSSTLGKLYGDRSTYKALYEAVGLHRAPNDVPKTWEKVERLEGLLAFDVGTVVAMEGKGVGRVVEANLGLESFKVDFERIRGLTVGFKAAPKLLRPLAPDHVLRRKLEQPQALKALTPPELLRTTLQSYDRALTAGEVRDILAGIVSEAQWTAWWGAARKHPQVVASGAGARQTYHWAESSGDAMDSVWKAFEKAAPRRRIERLKREGARDAGRRDRMAEDLAAAAEAAMA